jgi:hypothetical protein
MRFVEFGDQSATLVTHTERPDLGDHAQGEDFLSQWPAFMFHDPVADEHYPVMYERCPEFQFYIVDDGGSLLGNGNSIPVAWDGSPEDLPGGWDEALIRGTLGAKDGTRPTALCALQATVSSLHGGRGLGPALTNAMRVLARDAGLDSLIAPVRPSLKAEYPLIPIDDYVTWRREDGLFFDPWMRVHERLGAGVLAIAHESMTIPGSRSDWEAWTGLSFPSTGEYIVDGALAPVVFDAEADRGVYVEPNVWMLHLL